MDTEFVELIVTNFGPFVGEHRLKLANGANLTFIKGRNEVEPRLGANGAGKSKLLNAIPWCLYGRTSDDLATTDIKPWGKAEPTSVTVKLITWEGEEGVRHTITRTAGPNSLTLNKKPCAQADIEKLVGWSLPVFRQAVFLGQGQPLFHDLPNREKLEFLVDVLGLDRWDKYAERASTRTAALERQLAQVVGKLEGNAVRVEELGNQVKRQKAEADNWESWRLGRLEEVESQIKDMAKEYGKLDKLHASLSVRLDGAGLEYKLIRADLDKATQVASDADVVWRTAKANRLTAQQQHEEAAAELDVLLKERRCPTCGNMITKEDNFLANKKRLEAAVRQYAKEANGTAVVAANKLLEKARAKAANLATQAQTLAGQAEALENEERLVRRAKETAEVTLQAAKANRDELEGNRNPHRDRLVELRKAHKAAIADGEAWATNRADLEAQVEATRYWVKGFKDVRLFVLQDVLDELEFTTNGMLDAMGLLGWEVRYDVERETKSGTIQRGLMVTVIPSQRDENRVKYQEALSAATGIKFKSWSGGEGQRLRIAGALALSQVLLARAGVECNLEVLDEPTRHLSDEGVEDLCDFLADRARTLGKAVYLIDHKAIEGTRFARTLTVVKDKAGSRIE